MEENILIRSENGVILKKKLITVSIIFLIFIILTILSFVFHKSISRAFSDKAYATSPFTHNITRRLLFFLDDVFYFAIPYIFLGISSLTLIFLIVFLLLYLSRRKQEITVTDRRVFGKAAFGKRVDLPIDSISAVATSVWKGITVASSSGKMKFYGIQNRDEIHKVISDLLIARQGYSTTVIPMEKPDAPQSVADELIKFKTLLDEGVITQEEFDAKKKQLLGF